MSHVCDAYNINNDFEMYHNVKCIQNEIIRVVSSAIGTVDGVNRQVVIIQYKICT